MRAARHLTGMTIALLLAAPAGAEAGTEATTTGTAPVAPVAPVVLVGEVGPGYTITLKDRAGKPARKVRPGRYTFVIRDRATNHDFRLRGPGLNLTSGVAPVGTKRWTVRLRAGRYLFLCTPHPLFMRGALTVA